MTRETALEGLYPFLHGGKQDDRALEAGLLDSLRQKAADSAETKRRCLVVGSDSIHRIQECHVAIYHILWDLAHTLLAADRGGLGSVGEEATR